MVKYLGIEMKNILRPDTIRRIVQLYSVKYIDFRIMPSKFIFESYVEILSFKPFRKEL